MKTSVLDVLAVLALIAGVSGLLFSVGVPPVAAVSVFATGLAGIYLFALYLQRRRSQQFTLLKVSKTVVIEDEAGRVSTLTRTTRQRANQVGLDEVWCRNIVSDGPISDIASDGEPVAPDCIVRNLGLIDVKKKIAPPTTNGTLVDWELSYRMEDSFPTSSESLIHLVNTPTVLLTLTVQFPKKRAANKAEIWEKYGETARNRVSTIQALGETITAEVEHPKLGGQYSLEWNW